MSAVTAPADASILSREALAFVELLHRELDSQRQELLALRGSTEEAQFEQEEAAA